MVYCLSNSFGTDNFDSCKRRSSTGLLRLNRPSVIGEYNRYMGGVDLADLRRLHCNSTIMGQHRWWLKLFFYLLDVETANALVLYNDSMKDKMNIFEFKQKLVTSLLGSRLDDNTPTIPPSHALIINPDEGRHMCAYCGLTGTLSRTRFCCQADDCKLQLCSFGYNKLKTEDKRQDCFALSHANEATRQLCLQRQDKMKLKTNKEYLK
jgi:Transposase IS4